MHFSGVIVEPGITREVGSSLLLTLLDYRSTHQSLSNQKLCLKDVVTQDVVIFEELEIKRPEDSTHSFAGNELSEVKLQKRISEFNILFAGL